MDMFGIRFARCFIRRREAFTVSAPRFFQTNIVNWAISSIDSIFIGRFFDTIVPRTVQTVPMSLVSTPMTNLVVTVQKVLFPAYFPPGTQS